MKIKICGIKRDQDADVLNAALPDYVGFVFAESRRQVSPLIAKKIRAVLSPKIVSVGVFVNANRDEIVDLFFQGVITIAQLHGNESPQFLTDLRHACPKLLQIKALAMTAEIATNQRLADIYAASDADYFLCDNARGGSGQKFSWNTLPKMTKPFWLAGGLSPENLASAMQIKPSPFALDLSSGVETSGDKDPGKIIAAVNAVKERGK